MNGSLARRNKKTSPRRLGLDDTPNFFQWQQDEARGVGDGSKVCSLEILKDQVMAWKIKKLRLWHNKPVIPALYFLCERSSLDGGMIRCSCAFITSMCSILQF